MSEIKPVTMVDVSHKQEVYREASAVGCISLRHETIERIKKGLVEKGDVFTVTSTVAILGVKKTPELLPFCHPIRIDNIDVSISIEDNRVCVSVTVKTRERTGVEMEALTGVALALLNIWDMVKKYEKDEQGQYPYTEINSIRVVRKTKSTTS